MAAAPCAQAAPASVDGATLAPVAFDAISKWRDDHHELAFAAFLKGCAASPPLRTALPEPAGLRAACEAAQCDGTVGWGGSTTLNPQAGAGPDSSTILQGPAAGAPTSFTVTAACEGLPQATLVVPLSVADEDAVLAVAKASVGSAYLADV